MNTFGGLGSLVGSAVPPSWSQVARGTARTDPKAQQSPGTHPSVPIADPPLEAENAALNAALAASNAENAALKAALAASNAQKAELQHHNTQLQQQYATLLADAKARLAEKDRKYQEGVQLFQEVEAANTGLKHALYLLSIEKTPVLNRLRDEITELRNQLEQAHDEIAQLHARPTIDPEAEARKAFTQVAKQAAAVAARVIPRCAKIDQLWFHLQQAYGEIAFLRDENEYLNRYHDVLDQVVEINQGFVQRFLPSDNPETGAKLVEEYRACEAVPVATPVEPIWAIGVPVPELPGWVEHARYFICELLTSLGLPVPDFTTMGDMPLADQITMLDAYGDSLRNLRDAANTPLPDDDDESAVEAVIPSDGMPSAKEIVRLILSLIGQNKDKLHACQCNIPNSERKPIHHAIFDTSIMPEYVKSLSRNDQLCLYDNVEKFFRQNCKPLCSAQKAGADRKAKDNAKANANAIKASIAAAAAVARAPTPASNTSIKVKVLNRGEIGERTPRPPNPPNGTPHPTKGSSA